MEKERDNKMAEKIKTDCEESLLEFNLLEVNIFNGDKTLGRQ